jgi:hypothetical protein
MTLIRKKTELSVETTLKMLIYGQPGAGKTTLALSAPNPLLLDFDGGVNRANYGHIGDTVPIKSWEDCLNVLDENLSPYGTLVIDTAGKMLDFMSAYIIEKNSKHGKNGVLTLPGYGERKGMFRQFSRRIMLMGKHLVFVAHRDTQKNNDEIRYVPLFGGSSYDDLVTDLDLVGYVETVGNKRTITFNPADRSDGKNTCNLPPLVDLPIVVDDDGKALANTFLTTNIINVYLDNIRKRREQNIAFEKVMNEVRENVELVTDARSAQDLLERLPEFQHAGNSLLLAKRALNDKAKALGLSYNAEMKTFEKLATK